MSIMRQGRQKEEKERHMSKKVQIGTVTVEVLILVEE